MNLGKLVYEKMVQIKLLQLQPFFVYVYINQQRWILGRTWNYLIIQCGKILINHRHVCRDNTDFVSDINYRYNIMSCMQHHSWFWIFITCLSHLTTFKYLLPIYNTFINNIMNHIIVRFRGMPLICCFENAFESLINT